VGEAGLSSAEVGKEITEHRRHHLEHGDASRGVAIAEALLLAVVAVLTAWSGFASAKWSTESRLLLAEASAARTEASTAALQADEARNLDEEAFALWFTAFSVDNVEAMATAESMFSAELAVAFDAWSDQSADGDADTGGPIQMPEYERPGLAEAEALETQASGLSDEGSEAASTADDYVRTTLYLASVLFLVGISGHFRVRAARAGLVVVGLCLTLFATWQIIGLPAPPG
jgi:hypothetical protein